MIDFIQERDKQSSASSSLEDIVDDACPGLVQRYIEKILVLSLSDKGKFAYLPFQFVQVALDLGFANPNLYIHGNCLGSVVSALIHCSAIAMHQKLFDKHESLVDSSYQESIRKAFDAELTSPSFQLHLHHHSPVKDFEIKIPNRFGESIGFRGYPFLIVLC